MFRLVSERSQMNQKTLHEFNHFDDYPNSAFIKVESFAMLMSVSRTTIWRAVKNGEIPAPKKISGRSIGFNVGEIRTYLESKGVCCGH